MNFTSHAVLSFLSAIIAANPENRVQNTQMMPPNFLQSLIFLPEAHSALAWGEEHLRNAFGGIKDESCSRDLHLFWTDLLQMRSWALQMADGTAKTPQSLTSGVTVFPGDFDGCLAVGPVRGSKGTFRGRHCLASLCYATEGSRCATKIEEAVDAMVELGKLWQQEGRRVNVTRLLKLSRGYPLRWGVCLPSSCSVAEVRGLVQRLAAPLSKHGLRMQMDDADCTVANEDHRPHDAAHAAALLLYRTAVVLCVAATIYDYITKDWCERRWKVLLAFSVLLNGRRLLRTHDDTRAMLPCLHGLRVASIMAVVVGHRVLWTFTTGLVLNTHYIQQLWKSYVTLPLKMCMFSVDIFLVLSGLLVTYVICNHNREGKSMNWLAYYIHRIIRLWPLLLMVLLLQSTILPHLGDGPIWKQYVVCEVPWWPIVLFVSNFYSLHRCVGYTWYVAVDTQLYFLAPPLLALLLRRPRSAIRLLALLAAAGVILRYWVAYHYQMPVNTGIYGGGNARIAKTKLLYSPYCRCPSFIMGMILGYKLHVIKYLDNHQAVTLRRNGALLWMATVVLISGAGLLTHEITQLQRAFDPIWDPMALAITNNIVALAACLAVYLCCTGRGGVFGQLSSWGGWRPLSRLTYAVYMVHVSVVLLSTGTARGPTTITVMSTIQEAAADYLLSVIIALPLSLLFESPIIELEHLLMDRNSKFTKVQDHAKSLIIFKQQKV